MFSLCIYTLIGIVKSIFVFYLILTNVNDGHLDYYSFTVVIKVSMKESLFS